MTTINDIPEEVRIAIFSELPQSQVIHTLRLVCKQWRDDIDQLYHVKVEIDDRKAGWERVLSLRVKHCRISHFLQPPPSGLGTTTFKFPNLIRTLIIYNHISPFNFFCVIADTAPSLTELKIINIGFHLLGFDFPSKFSTFHFQRLQALDLSLCTIQNPDANSTEAFPFSPFMNAMAGKSVARIFKDFLGGTFPSLVNFRTEIRCFGFDQTSSLIATVLAFIAAHNHVKCIDFELMVGHGLPTSEYRPLSESDLETIDMNKLKSVQKLDGLRIVSSSPIGVNHLIDLLEQQTALRHLEIDVFPAPCAIFPDIVTKNAKKLVSVEITDLCIWDAEGNGTPFDATAFTDCHGLRKLILDRNVGRRRMFDMGELINLNCLPESLEELAVNYFNIRTEDLVLFVNSGAGQHIQALMLTQCGSSGEYGVNGTVLECIIELPSISFIEISPLNFSDPEESDSLNLILEDHGYTPNHAYFQLRRPTIELPVRLRAFIFGDQFDDEDEDNDEDD